MLVGPFPAASSAATWLEQIEFRDAEDDSLLDLSTALEVTILIQDASGVDMLSLTMSNGDIVFPSLGIMEIRAEKGAMQNLLVDERSKTFNLGLVIQTNEDDFVQIWLGTLPVLNGVVR